MKVAIVYNKKTIDENDVINVFGMPTKEHYSPKTVERVARALEKGGHTVKIIEGGMNFIEEMKDFMPKVIAGERPGMVFNMAYGIQGQNRYTHVPAMLEMLGIPYVGSGPEAHAVVQDKVMTKIVLQKNNIPTPGFWVFSSPDDKFDDLVFPVIVKPKMESTSMGMEIVDNWDDLRKAVKDQIEKYSQITKSEIGESKEIILKNTPKVAKQTKSSFLDFIEKFYGAKTKGKQYGQKSAELLREIGELRYAGFITEEEYIAKKKELLDRI